jgi:hypothetical protein
VGSQKIRPAYDYLSLANIFKTLEIILSMIERYEGQIKFAQLVLPRAYQGRQDSNGKWREIKEKPGNLEPRDFAGLYFGPQASLELAVVCCPTDNPVQAGNLSFPDSTLQLSRRDLDSRGVVIKSRELPKSRIPRVLLGKELYKQVNKKTCLLDLDVKLRYGIAMLNENPYRYTIEILPNCDTKSDAYFANLKWPTQEEQERTLAEVLGCMSESDRLKFSTKTKS